MPTPVKLDDCPPPDPSLSTDERRLIGLRQALLDLMRYYSEENWLASWAAGLEVNLWCCAIGRSRRIRWQEAEGLRALAEQAGGWWEWGAAPQPEFVPMQEWLSSFATWERSRGTSR